MLALADPYLPTNVLQVELNLDDKRPYTGQFDPADSFVKRGAVGGLATKISSSGI